jgi:hypothetical protein
MVLPLVTLNLHVFLISVQISFIVIFFVLNDIFSDVIYLFLSNIIFSNVLK